MLTEQEKVLKNIVTGEVYSNRQEAYEVGCMGRPYCSINLVNPYSDQKDEEFFKPRRNTGKIQFEYYLELKGEPLPEYDWTQYISNRKNQGATNTCYLQVYGTIVEILMTKKIRELTPEFWESWLSYVQSQIQASND